MAFYENLASKIIESSAPLGKLQEASAWEKFATQFQANLDRYTSPFIKKEIQDIIEHEYTIDPYSRTLAKALGDLMGNEKWVKLADSFDIKQKEYTETLQKIENVTRKIKNREWEKIPQIPVIKKYVKQDVAGLMRQSDFLKKLQDKGIIKADKRYAKLKGITDLNITSSKISKDGKYYIFYNSAGQRIASSRIKDLNNIVERNKLNIKAILEKAKLTEAQRKKLIKQRKKELEQQLEKLKKQAKRIKQEFKDLRKQYHATIPGRSELEKLVSKYGLLLLSRLRKEPVGAGGKALHSEWLKTVRENRLHFSNFFSQIKDTVDEKMAKLFDRLKPHYNSFVWTLIYNPTKEALVNKWIDPATPGDNFMVTIRDLNKDIINEKAERLYITTTKNYLDKIETTSDPVTRKMYAYLATLHATAGANINTIKKSLPSLLAPTIYSNIMGNFSPLVNPKLYSNPVETFQTQLHNVRSAIGIRIKDMDLSSATNTIKQYHKQIMRRLKESGYKDIVTEGIFRGTLDPDDYEKVIKKLRKDLKDPNGLGRFRPRTKEELKTERGKLYMKLFNLAFGDMQK